MSGQGPRRPQPQRHGSPADSAHAERSVWRDDFVDAHLRLIGHRFNNCLHRLYLLSDRLNGEAERPDAVRATAHAIDEVLPELESLSKATLAYFAPLDPHASTLRLEEVLQSFYACPGVSKSTLRSGHELASAAVIVDPGLLSVVLRTLGSRVSSVRRGLGGGAVETLLDMQRGVDSAALRVEVSSSSGPVHRAEAGGDPTAGKAGPDDSLDWALAQKYMAVQGGVLDECWSEDGCSVSWTVSMALADRN